MSQPKTYQMTIIPLVVTKKYEGQRVTSSWQPATPTDRDPNRDNILARSNQPRTSETDRRQDDVFGYELQLLVSAVLPVPQNLNYKLQRRLSDMCCPSNKVIKSNTRSFPALGGEHEGKLCDDTLQGMTPTNVKTVHQTSLLHIKRNLDRLGLLSPTHCQQRSQQQSWQITFQSVLIHKPTKFLKVTRHCRFFFFVIPRSMVVEALSW